MSCLGSLIVKVLIIAMLVPMIRASPLSSSEDRSYAPVWAGSTPHCSCRHSIRRFLRTRGENMEGTKSERTGQEMDLQVSKRWMQCFHVNIWQVSKICSTSSINLTIIRNAFNSERITNVDIQNLLNTHALN